MNTTYLLFINKYIYVCKYGMHCIYLYGYLNFVSQEDRSRVEIFHEYAQNKNEPVCGNFLNLLNAADGFINNMSARIIAKFACYSSDLINQTDLQFYLNWIKEQLLSAVRFFFLTLKKLFLSCFLIFRI